MGDTWQGHTPGTGGYRRLLTGLFLAGVATFAQLYSPQGLLPLISQDLGVSADQAALLISTSTLGLALSVIPWAFIGDRIGRKRAMTWSIVLACTAAVVTVVVPTFELMLAFRLLEGLALGGVPALALAYLNEEVHPKTAAQAAGTYVGGTVIGGLSGRIVAAPLGDLLGWRLGVLVVVVLAVLCAAGFVALSPRALNFVPGRQSLTEALRSITGNLRSPLLLSMYLHAMLLMGGFVAIYNFLGFHLMEEPFFLPVSLVSMVFLAYLAGSYTSPWAGKQAGKYGHRRVLILLVIVMIGAVLLTLTPWLWLVIIGLVVFTGAFFGAHSVASGWAASGAVAGRAQSSALYNVGYYTGSSLFGWLGGVFLHFYGWSGTVLMTAGLAVISLILALVVRPERPAADGFSSNP
ncbi:MFS transporter [Citricoccus sp. NR2]|uniref:MFS transporter n=1 Tax=Citricoccus sp. NR2 TaxID=3004095 RepID=UPI0022DD99BC|nr:MFS transporter [Citricoccus sp. NR2]WBL19182.1 MFS transporter [Citricoccus sp. NR2]